MRKMRMRTNKFTHTHACGEILILGNINNYLNACKNARCRETLVKTMKTMGNAR